MDKSDQKPPVKTYCGGKPNYCTPEGREDIIKMAREAGFEIDCCSLEWHDRIERFAALVAQHERERIIAANAPEIERCNAYIKMLEEAMPPKILRTIRARGQA